MFFLIQETDLFEQPLTDRPRDELDSPTRWLLIHGRIPDDHLTINIRDVSDQWV